MRSIDLILYLLIASVLVGGYLNIYEAAHFKQSIEEERVIETNICKPLPLYTEPIKLYCIEEGDVQLEKPRSTND